MNFFFVVISAPTNTSQMFVILRDVLTAGQNNKRDHRICVRNKFTKKKKRIYTRVRNTYTKRMNTHRTV